MVVWKNVQDSQIDSKWQSIPTGRALRKPRRKDGERRGKIPGMVHVSLIMTSSSAIRCIE